MESQGAKKEIRLPNAQDIVNIAAGLEESLKHFDLPKPKITFQVGPVIRRKIDEELFYRGQERRRGDELQYGDVVNVNYNGIEIAFE